MPRLILYVLKRKLGCVPQKSGLTQGILPSSACSTLKYNMKNSAVPGNDLLHLLWPRVSSQLYRASEIIWKIGSLPSFLALGREWPCDSLKKIRKS